MLDDYLNDIQRGKGLKYVHLIDFFYVLCNDVNMLCISGYYMYVFVQRTCFCYYCCVPIDHICVTLRRFTLVESKPYIVSFRTMNL